MRWTLDDLGWGGHQRRSAAWSAVSRRLPLLRDEADVVLLALGSPASIGAGWPARAVATGAAGWTFARPALLGRLAREGWPCTVDISISISSSILMLSIIAPVINHTNTITALKNYDY